MRVVYASWGPEIYHYRAFYSMLSFQREHPNSNHTLVLYTTQPSFFAQFPFPIETHPLIPAQLELWKGVYGIPHLIKLHVLAMEKSSFVYLDSDTVIEQCMDSWFAKIDAQNSLMLEFEYALEKAPMQSDRYQKLISQLNHPLIHSLTRMYNAGCIGLHSSNLDLIPKAIELTHQILKAQLLDTAEQLAVSVLLQERTHVHEIKECMDHYWAFKEANDPTIRESIDKIRKH